MVYSDGLTNNQTDALYFEVGMPVYQENRQKGGVAGETQVYWYLDAIAKDVYVFLFPKEISFKSWESVLNNMGVVKAFGITFLRTVIVTVFQTVITPMFAYGFSRDNLMGKNFMPQWDFCVCI